MQTPNGILPVDKPAGWTSFDVLAKLRGALGTRKLGHSGTLDPMATGVLAVFIGKATSAADRQLDHDKTYEATIRLGLRTDTGDVTGTTLETAPVTVGERELRTVLPRFMGDRMQLPPMYSAIKINGKKLYQLARQGVEVERTARPIEVYKLELLHYTANSFTVRVACSKGTYIRVLGEDLATALGTCGTMSFLLRTQVGAYMIDKACTLQEIAENPEACAAEPLTAVAELPKLKVNARQAARITNGVRTTVAQTADGRYVLLGPGDEFLGIVRCEQERLQAEKILEHYPMPEE